MIVAPFTVVHAEDGVKEVSNAEELIEAFENAEDGDIVRLMQDIAMDAPNDPEIQTNSLHPLSSISQDLTLDLNGYRICLDQKYADQTLPYTPLFITVQNGAEVTITGDGTIDTDCGYNNNVYGINIIQDSSVTVENGTYIGSTTAIQVTRGTLTIYDGTFIQGKAISEVLPQYAKYVINCIDRYFADGSARIYAKGGRYCFDPSANPENSEITYVPDGCVCEKDEASGYWIVRQLPYVAAIGDTQYYSLADAVAASKDGDIIEVLDDSVGRGIMVKASDGPKKVTIDFNGHTYTMGGPAVGSTGTESQAWHIQKGNTFILKDGTLDLLPEEQQEGNVGKMLFQNYCNLTLEDMTLDGTNLVGSGTYTLSNNYGTISIKGNTTIIAKQGGYAFDVYRWASNGYEQINVTVDTTGVIDGRIEVTADGNSEKKSTLTIKNGYFKKELQVKTTDVLVSISGGYFNNDVSAYVANDYTLVPSDMIGYTYMVIEKTSVGGVEIFPDVAAPTVHEIEDKDNMNPDEVSALKTAAETVKVDGMVSESQNVVDEINEDNVTEATKQLEEAVDVSGDQTVTLYVQTYLDITPISFNSNDNVLTLDITPMIQIVASTADKAEDIVTEEKATEDNPQNAVIYKEAKALDMEGQNVTVVLKLPSTFTIPVDTSVAYVLHAKENGEQYVYTGTVSDDRSTFTFTNPNGFSEFTVYADDPSAARVYAQDESIEENAGIGYMSLQDAVDAVKNGGTIVAKRGGEATVSASKSFTVISGENKIALSAGKNYRRKATDNPDGSVTYTFTYRGSSGSSSSGGSPLPTVGEPTTPSEPSTPSTPSGFVSDTTNDLTVDGVYQFRITSLDGTIPFLTADNANFRVEFASQEGNDFFFKIHAQGAAGSTTVVSVNGVRLLTATVGGSATGVISDTTAPFTVKKGETYQFRLTASERPSFAAGSASFTVEYAGQIGSDYFYKVYAAGNVGDGCGFYINGEASPVAVATIA